MLLTKIFYEVDNFCKSFIEVNKLMDCKRRGPMRSLTESEILTILIYFHCSGKRTFKDYYLTYIKGFLSKAFPEAPSYNRFIELIPGAAKYLFIFINYSRLGANTGIGYIDSTPLAVCHNLRIYSNKVFKGIAERGKTSTGWFYGFKLHLIINEYGEITAFDLTSGNIDDRNKKVIKKLLKYFHGKLFGDRGYLSKSLFKELYEKGITLFTRVKKGMKNVLLSFEDKMYLSKRGVIEAVNGLLKSECQIEHTRHRSPVNFFVNLISGLIAYSFRDKKPCIKRSLDQQIACAK